jgi:rhamnogalacturonyl hydrolase YesR
MNWFPFLTEARYYWWEAGAAWGGMIEYTKSTGDDSYVKSLHKALVANYGPDKNLLLPWKKDQTVCACFYYYLS